jgi:anti-sigma B factor antagonist
VALEHRLVDSVEVTEDKVHIIHLKSVFDASTADEFEQVLHYLMANQYYKFVIDLTRVEFISSAGWGNFVGELQAIRDNKGDLKLSGMNKDVYDVYLLLELDMFIRAYPNADKALSDFSKNILGVEHKFSKESQSLKQKFKNQKAKTEHTNHSWKINDEHSTQPAFPFSDGLSGSGLNEDEIVDSWFEGEGEIELSIESEPSILEMHLQSEQVTSQIASKSAIDRSSMLPKQNKTKNGFNENFGYLNESKIRSTDLNSDPLLEKIVSVVIANPVYGPSAIRQMLIKMSLADESLPRALISQKLQDVDLSTRAKRIAFAHANSL